MGHLPLRLDLSVNRKIKIIACENLREELEAVAQLAGWQTYTVATYPADCIKAVASRAAAETTAGSTTADPRQYDLTIRLQCNPNQASVTQKLDSRHIEIQFKSCFDLLAATALIESYQRAGAYLVTPGWLLRWRTYIEYWGFDQALATEYFRESATKIVLLDTTRTPQSQERLKSFCEFIGRPGETLPVGLEYLHQFLVKNMLDWQVCNLTEAQSEAVETNRRFSYYAMVFNMITDLTGIREEKVVIEKIIQVFDLLFAPGEIIYLPYDNQHPGQPFPHPKTPAHFDVDAVATYSFRDNYFLMDSDDGFAMKIDYQNEWLGVIVVRRLTFPQYRHQYLNLALTIVNVCGLAISNARNYQRLEGTIAELNSALEEVKTLQGILPICANCKKIRDDKGFWHQVDTYFRERSAVQFTHGICPECKEKLYKDILKKPS